MINNESKLIRTDSTGIDYIPYKKNVGIILTPLGRIRRIKRLDKELAEEYNSIYKEKW